MRFRTALLLFPCMAFAQTPPADVDAALRARASEFLQYHVDGSFRKAMDLVADDTKDYYFASAKLKLRGFRLKEIEYFDNFSKAKVTAEIDRTWAIHGEEVPVTVFMTTTWKVENGKWFWYYNVDEHPNLTPMGPSDLDQVKKWKDIPNPASLPKDLTDEKSKQMATEILKESTVSKSSVRFETGKASADQVVFHNGLLGAVQLEMVADPAIPGLKVEIAQPVVMGKQDGTIKFTYQPVANAKPGASGLVKVGVQPLGQLIQVRVNFDEDPSAK